MAKIISISNHKGGVGKTTTAINLSAALAHYNRRVLLVDLDPQGNASRGLGIDISLLNKCVFDCLVDKASVSKVIKKTQIKNLDVLPSKLVLASFDEKVEKKEDSYFILKNTLDKIREDYDYMIIDCPPSMGYLSINALTAANTVLIPVQCEFFALEAVTQFLATISEVQLKYNPDLGIEGFLLTMFDPKTTLGIEISTSVRGMFKENTFSTQIPRNVSLPESNMKGLPLTIYKPTSSGALAYFSLAKEVLDHEN